MKRDALSRAGWSARWVWVPGLTDRPNTYVLLRRRFSLRATEARRAAKLHITAGHFYHVYLNGRLLGRGPDTCYFEQKIYHSYEVSGCLRTGSNVLAVRVHFWGEQQPGGMQRLAEGPAGCLAQLELDGRAVVWTDSDWKGVHDPAFEDTRERINPLREWRESYHAARALRDWSLVAFDDRAWPAVTVVAPATGGPWKRLLPKATAEMTQRLVQPVNLYLSRPHGALPPDHDTFRLYNMIGGEPLRWPGIPWISNEHQEWQELLFDFGRVRAGYPRIDLTAAGPASLEVHYGDSLSMQPIDTLHLAKGRLQWSPFGRRGARFLRLVLRHAARPVRVRSVRWVALQYPVKQQGGFAASDERLGAIWDLCARSAATNGLDHFTDCVGREQALWMMDFYLQAPQHAFYFGDTTLAREGFRLFADLQLANGHILCYGPSSKRKELWLADEPRTSPSDYLGFNFYFVLAVRDFYEATADRAFLRRYAPVCERSLHYYGAAERAGFAAPPTPQAKHFIEWGYPMQWRCAEEPRAVCAFTQALYYRALKAQSALAQALGQDAVARVWERKAAVLERRFFRAFSDPESGRIADYVHGRRRFHYDTFETHAAVLRAFDHIPPRVRAAALDLVIGRKARPSQTGVGMALAVEALFRQDAGCAALQLLRDYWGAMLAAGLQQTPEHYALWQPRGSDARYSPGYSRCHAYASFAGVLLQREILGARVHGTTMVVRPFFGPLDWARGNIPTAAGPVQVYWRRRAGRFHVTVRAPRALTVRFQPRDPDAIGAFRVLEI